MPAGQQSSRIIVPWSNCVRLRSVSEVLTLRTCGAVVSFSTKAWKVFRSARRLFAALSHETRIARQILSPIAEIVRRHQDHRKRDAHAVRNRDAERRGACAGKKRRHLRRTAFSGQAQRGPECDVKMVGP